MRDILERRLDRLGIVDEDFMIYLWPKRDSQPASVYHPKDTRYRVIGKPNLDGIPRFSIDYFLQHNCTEEAITDMLPLIDKDTNTFRRYVAMGYRMRQPGAVARHIAQSADDERIRRCQNLKSHFDRGAGWNNMYTSSVLRSMYDHYSLETGSKHINAFLTRFRDPEYRKFQRYLYDIARSSPHGDVARMIRELGDAHNFGSSVRGRLSRRDTLILHHMKHYLNQDATMMEDLLANRAFQQQLNMLAGQGT